MEVYQTPNGRFYRTPKGNFPSVNTVLSATMPSEKKRAIAAWAIREKDKWLRGLRKCQNCGLFDGAGGCKNGRYGQKLRSPWKKNNCPDFQILPELDNYDPRSAALSRGSSVHESIEEYFRSGELPPPETFPQGQQIAFLLKNLRDGALLIEEPVFSLKHGYAGRVDFCGIYRGETVVFDWTTSGRDFIQEEWYADKLTQAAAYAIAIEESFLYTVDQVAVVVIGPDRSQIFRDPLNVWAPIWLNRLEQYKLQEVPF